MAGGRVISAVLTLKDKDFTATAKKAARSLTDTERQALNARNGVSKFGESATSNFKKVALGAASIAAAIGVTKALSSAFNMVRNSVGSAFERIDTMERFDRVMTTLTGSTEQAKTALDATNEAVKGTAYGLDIAAKGVQDFVTRGMDVDKATYTMEAFGDAVAFYGEGSNEQLSSVMDALAKMSSKGKVSMDQMNRLFDAGIDGVGIYAQATNQSAEVVQSALSNGSISAEDFIDTVSTAMMEGTNGVENISGAAKEAGATWGATFDNMRAAVTRGVQGIILKIDEMLEENGLPDMRTMVSNFGSRFENVLEGLGDKIPAFTTALAGIYEKVQPGLDWIKETGLPGLKEGLETATGAAKSAFDFVVDNWPLISPIIAGVTATILAYKVGVVAIRTATAAWSAVTATTNVVVGLLNGTLALTPFGWIVIGIGAVVGAGVALYKNFDKVKAAAGWLWEKLQDNPLLALVAGPFGALIAAGVSLYNNFDKIKAAFDRFKNAISKFKLPKWVSTVGSALGSAASSVGNFFRGGPQESFAVGTNAVREDMVAQVHKGEMIIPAKQSENLRKQGVNINNIDKGGLRQRVRPSKPSVGKSINIAKLADQIVVREESDIDKIATMLVRKLENVNFNMA